MIPGQILIYRKRLGQSWRVALWLSNWKPVQLEKVGEVDEVEKADEAGEIVHQPSGFGRESLGLIYGLI